MRLQARDARPDAGRALHRNDNWPMEIELLTAAESEDQQRRIAGALHARGLEPGDRIALLTSSTGAMLSAILGSLRVGIVPVLLNSGLLPAERDALLDDAQPQLLVDDMRKFFRQLPR